MPAVSEAAASDADAHPLLAAIGPAAERLAISESLEAHGLSVRARLDRLNHLGDVSANGLKQSHGLMVNYLYDLGQIEVNHEGFAERSHVAASDSVRAALPALRS